jgi:hypothetical protein
MLTPRHEPTYEVPLWEIIKIAVMVLICPPLGVVYAFLRGYTYDIERERKNRDRLN